MQVHPSSVRVFGDHNYWNYNYAIVTATQLIKNVIITITAD